MRFIFKTDYNQDLRLLKHSGYWWSYGVLAAFLILAPFGLDNYLVSQLVFVFIYALVGVSLTILTGFTGQVSLGHAAFLAIGAYTAGFLQSLGVPFIIYFPAAAIVTGLVGMLVAIPALRLSGIYLVIATIAFAFIIEEVAARWEAVTHGNEGMRVRTLDVFGGNGVTLPRDEPGFYFLCLGILVLMVILALNLARSPTGRAFMAIRDSETAAKSMGVNLALYKVKSFTISAAITGMAGVLFAHKLSFISPEMFTLLLSLEFIMVIIIGGIIGLHGAVLGAIFIVMIDPFLTLLKDDVPGLVSSIALLFGAAQETAASIGAAVGNVGSAPGMKGALYGLIIIFFIIFEPYGLYGRWLKVKLYFQLFPLYKKATFKRQKTYVKSERNR
ncbi:MAG: Branchedchain amino acid transport system permease protein LivM [Alphaproteobacteria bacterium]|jgi:branched-chain amino acid transport system permease protein|nr:Branchedchain amino acid transport system permease protein LivM [Alphaproteobacteria bacterium]